MLLNIFFDILFHAKTLRRKAVLLCLLYLDIISMPSANLCELCIT